MVHTIQIDIPQKEEMSELQTLVAIDREGQTNKKSINLMNIPKEVTTIFGTKRKKK